MNTKTNTRRRAVVAAVMAASALALVPAAGQAHPHFGAKLTPEVQPSNAGSPRPCEITPGANCTRVMVTAYGTFGTGQTAKAPRNGTIKQLRLIAGAPGSFRLQLARIKASTHEARITRNGPVIHHLGQPVRSDESDDFTSRIETFALNLKVKKGEVLAIKAPAASVMNCSGGGFDQLIFQPTLRAGGPFTATNEGDGCTLLLEAVMR
jgi:hypothetical protein